MIYSYVVRIALSQFDFLCQILINPRLFEEDKTQWEWREKGPSTIMLISLLAAVAGSIFFIVIAVVMVKRCRSNGSGE